MHVITIKWNQHPLMMLIHLAGHCCGQKLAEKSDKEYKVFPALKLPLVFPPFHLQLMLLKAIHSIKITVLYI